MKDISLSTFITDYLTKAMGVQLATMSDHAQPWICTVGYASDGSGNIYWYSSKNTRHSKEIEANQNTAIAIVFDGKNRVGAQMTGIAKRVPYEDIEKVNSIYSAKFGDKPERLVSARSASGDAWTYYQFTPVTIKVHDELNSPTAPQLNVDLTPTS